MQDLLFKNARIATSTGEIQGDLLVQNGKIAGFGGEIRQPGAQVIDAAGKILMPGGIDPHTHFDLDVGFTRASDDFLTGSIAAACGGTTTVIDHMAFGPKGCRLTHQLGVYQKLAERCAIDYGLHGVVQHVDGAVLEDMLLMRDQEGVTSHKVYLTYDDMLPDGDFFKILQRAKELGLTVCVHCENDAAVNTLRAQFVATGKTEAAYHPLSRPPEAEAEAVFRTLMLAQLAGGTHIYVVHLSTKLGADAIALARANGQQNIYAETCPQYLFLDDSRYADPKEALKYIMSPPLRKAPDIASMWQGLETESTDTIGTDHCPFFFATQKQRGAQDFTRCPNGAPGVELRMALLFSEGVMKGRLTLPQMVRLCSTNAAQIFGLPQKGDLRPGADADLVLFDPDVRWTVQKAALHENVDYTPYEGMPLQGRPVLTVLRGQIIAKDGVFTGEAEFGRYLHRTPHTL